MKKILGVILILVGIYFGYSGIVGMQDSKSGIEIGDLEIAAKDEGQQTSSIIFIGVGVICLVGGIVLLRKS